MKTIQIIVLSLCWGVSFSLVQAYSGCYESRSMCEDIEDLGEEKIMEFSTPVLLASESEDLVDTWGASRQSGGSHEGTDIVAHRGALVVMPTDGVVDRADISGYGGKHVFVYIAGGEKLYFAHLDDWARNLDDGDILEKGEIVGYVGNTGATYASPHLHLAIYEDGKALNPYPRMKNSDWSLEEKMEALDLSFEQEKDEELVADIYQRYTSLFEQASHEDIELPEAIVELQEEQEDKREELEKDIADEIEEESTDQSISSDISEARKFSLFNEDLYFNKGDNEEVERLQKFLNDVERANIKETGVFDEETVEAVRTFQEKYKRAVLQVWGLSEPTGYVGITTRLKINFLIKASEQTSCPVFTEYNSRTKNKYSNEVKQTEELLRDLGFFSGAPNKTWDAQTHNALVRFQEKFSDTMLAPWGIQQGTGYKYKTTNKFMNYLVGCDTGAVNLDGVGVFDF